TWSIRVVRSVFLDSFYFSSRRRHTRWPRDWSSDVCSSDLPAPPVFGPAPFPAAPPPAPKPPAPPGPALAPPPPPKSPPFPPAARSEERRVGKECISGWAPQQEKKKKRSELRGRPGAARHRV